MQDIPWYGYVLLSISLAFWAWVGVSIIDLYRKYAGLAREVRNQEKTCAERLDWMREQDKTLAKLTGGQNKIVGMLEVMRDEHREQFRPEHRAD